MYSKVSDTHVKMATETVETETQSTEASTDTAVVTPITMSFIIMAMRSPRRGSVLNSA